MDFLVINQWQAAYKETVCEKTNQHDLGTALWRTICLGGVDVSLFEANEKDIDAIFPNDHDWMVYSQYSAVIFPTSLYCERIQSSKVVFHLGLVGAMSCLESFSRPYFSMGDNLSKAVGNLGADLTNPRMNQLVKKTMFEFDEEHEAFESHFETPMTCLIRLNVHDVQPTACWV